MKLYFTSEILVMVRNPEKICEPTFQIEIGNLIKLLLRKVKELTYANRFIKLNTIMWKGNGISLGKPLYIKHSGIMVLDECNWGENPISFSLLP